MFSSTNNKGRVASRSPNKTLFTVSYAKRHVVATSPSDHYRPQSIDVSRLSYLYIVMRQPSSEHRNRRLKIDLSTQHDAVQHFSKNIISPSTVNCMLAIKPINVWFKQIYFLTQTQTAVTASVDPPPLGVVDGPYENHVTSDREPGGHSWSLRTNEKRQKYLCVHLCEDLGIYKEVLTLKKFTYLRIFQNSHMNVFKETQKSDF